MFDDCIEAVPKETILPILNESDSNIQSNPKTIAEYNMELNGDFIFNNTKDANNSTSTIFNMGETYGKSIYSILHTYFIIYI